MANIFIRSWRSLPGQDNQIEENDKIYAYKDGTPTLLQFWMNMPELRAQYGDRFWIEISYRGVQFAIMEGMLNNWQIPTLEQFCPSKDLILHHGENMKMDLRYINASNSVVTGEGLAVVVHREGGSLYPSPNKTVMRKQFSDILTASGDTAPYTGSILGNLAYRYSRHVYKGNSTAYVPPALSTTEIIKDAHFRYENGQPNRTIFATVVDTYAEVQALFADWGEKRYLTGFAICAATNLAYAFTGYDSIFQKFVWGPRPNIPLNRLFAVGVTLRSGTKRYLVQADGTLLRTA